jgi:hypothetical protein
MILSFVLLLMLTSCGADLCGYECRYYSDANVILISLLCVCVERQGFTNWFMLEGLGLHGELDLQEHILRKWVALVRKTGIYEHYNPYTGEGYGTEGLGMSTLVCDYIYKYGWTSYN